MMGVSCVRKFVWLLFLLATGSFADGWDPGSKATAQGSIVNTRHNMTMSYLGAAAVFMSGVRNDYGAVCVYCHTPHGANKQIDAPLWNRTINNGTYVIYDRPTTLMRPIGQPGPSSLTCLSCHDGTIAIDSVLNMPGAGWEPMQTGATNNETGASNQSFLGLWKAAGNVGPPNTGPPLGTHRTLGPELGNGTTSETCAQCHNGAFSSGPDSFRAFMLGTDLRNDHPVGVLYPETYTPAADFYEPSVKLPGKMAFFDANGNGRADTNEVRLYDTGSGYQVECASCHDPHGVPSGGLGTRFNPTFLRINNGIGGSHAGTVGIASDGASALCLTCHVK